ncbi:sensor histidine kinase [Micrococcus sp. M4NT]|uniref:sensor histidine kinase n=1 Tax=Micrococcus sp. M4NT TaxID=2957501 RepID=UPI0029A52BEF|nr:sensor histidine kinase [Micrococcus sp. M4NT]MDX2340080.1 sensor histidine kinase [Micrococcus sp. M4NT]
MDRPAAAPPTAATSASVPPSVPSSATPSAPEPASVSGPGAAPEPGSARVLAGLRVALHVSFAGLLAVGLARALGGMRAAAGEGAAPGPFTAAVLVGLTGALAAVYLAGTVAERRRWVRGDGVGLGAATGWLALVLALWGLLVAHHGDFAWVAFPLFFVVLHVVALVAGPRALLRRVAGPVLVAAIAGVVVLGMAGSGDGVRPAAVIGPLVGAGVAVVLSGAYRALHEESERQRAVAAELRAARATLAATQHRAGALAERERLARDIHDTLTQGLASIVLVSRAAQDALRAGDADLAASRLETVRATAAESLADSRAFVRELRSGSTGAGLAESLEAVVRAFAAQQSAVGSPVAVDLDVAGTPVPVPAAVETALVRATRASLANVGQHARASRARVSLAFLPGELTLDVADDGVGLTPRGGGGGAAVGAAGRSTGVGLLSVRERLALLGGEATVESAPGEGTVVALRVPLAADASGTTTMTTTQEDA